MKKIFLSLILIAITLNSNPIDAKQLFNIEKVKVIALLLQTKDKSKKREF